MCKNCLGEFTVSMAYVKKDLNVLDKAALIAKLPVTTDHKNNVTARVDLVLKEDIAGIYDTSWQSFLEGTGERKTQMCSPRLPALSRV